MCQIIVLSCGRYKGKQVSFLIVDCVYCLNKIDFSTILQANFTVSYAAYLRFLVKLSSRSCRVYLTRSFQFAYLAMKLVLFFAFLHLSCKSFLAVDLVYSVQK